MNPAEKLAATYLRLNGFLLLPHFTVFTGAGHNHVDLVGYRPPNSRELVHGDSLPRDDELSSRLARELRQDATTLPVGVIAEVRGNRNRDKITPEHVRYVGSFLGGITPARIAFCLAKTPFRRDRRGLCISLGYAHQWIDKRIVWMERHCHLSKTGSWTLSEGFLADLLSLRRIQASIRNP